MPDKNKAWPPMARTLKRWCLWVVCQLSLTPAQAQMERLFAYPPRERVVRLLAPSPWLTGDTATVSRQLDSLAGLARQHQDDYLFWYAQLLKTRYPLYRHHTLAQGVQRLEAARAQLENCPIPASKAAYWHIYGLYLLEAGQYTNAFRLLLRAQQQFDQIGYAHVPEIMEYLYGVGSLYLRFGDYPKALHYLNLAERYHPPLPLRLRTNVLNTLGIVYQEVHDYAKADHWFRAALSEAQVMGDTAYLGIVTGNLGNILRLQGHPRQALPYLYRGLALSQRPVPENGATLCVHIASALLVLDSMGKANAYLNRSQQLVAHHTPQREYALTYGEARALYARKTGDLAQALWWTDSTTTLQDRLRAVFDGKRLLATESRLNAQQYLNRLQALAVDKQNAVRLRNLMLVALGLLTGAGLIALHQNRQKRLQEQQLHAERLSHATDQLTQYLDSLRQKNELIGQITDELAQARRLVAPTAPLPSETEQSIQTLLNSVILTEKDWQQFRGRFEEVYPRFFLTLRSQYPDLSPADVRLLALSKLGLPTKEMAFMLGVSLEAIRKARHRLRKKLEHLHSDTDLEGLIAQL